MFVWQFCLQKNTPSSTSYICIHYTINQRNLLFNDQMHSVFLILIKVGYHSTQRPNNDSQMEILGRRKDLSFFFCVFSKIVLVPLKTRAPSLLNCVWNNLQSEECDMSLLKTFSIEMLCFYIFWGLIWWRAGFLVCNGGCFVYEWEYWFGISSWLFSDFVE